MVVSFVRAWLFSLSAIRYHFRHHCISDAQSSAIQARCTYKLANCYSQYKAERMYVPRLLLSGYSGLSRGDRCLYVVQLRSEIAVYEWDSPIFWFQMRGVVAVQSLKRIPIMMINTQFCDADTGLMMFDRDGMCLPFFPRHSRSLSMRHDCTFGEVGRLMCLGRRKLERRWLTFWFFGLSSDGFVEIGSGKWGSMSVLMIEVALAEQQS